ncbi:MAG: CHASE domain-containing protein, partial [Paracoccaceae bacterium]|nr:CHASE domain-containing protein [Paracoccaceae bacterium]
MIETVTYVGIVLVFAALGMSLQRVVRLENNEERRAELFRTEAILAERLQDAINSKHLFARGLAGAISLRPDISDAEFAKFCTEIKTEDPSVVNMAFVKDMIVTHVYPMERNAPLIGRDLRAFPQQAAMIEEIARTGKTALEGPIPLLQGEPGYIIREPVFLVPKDGREPEYYGVASVVFTAELFLNQLRLSDFTQNYDIAVRAENTFGEGGMVFGDPAVFERAPEAQVLNFPSATWTFAVMPIAGQNVTPIGIEKIWSWIALAAIGSLVTAYYLHRLRRENARNLSRLRTAFNILPVGLVLFDSHDRLELCNEGYRSIYGKASEAMVPGATFESIL